MAKELHGWKVIKGEGVVTFSKGEHAVETTFDATDPDAASVAYEHALAQAYAIDNPGGLDGFADTDRQWRTIRAWEREGES